MLTRPSLAALHTYQLSDEDVIKACTTLRCKLVDVLEFGGTSKGADQCKGVSVKAAAVVNYINQNSQNGWKVCCQAAREAGSHSCWDCQGA